MTTEDLLKPRYKVIADYPQSPFEKEQIIQMDHIGGRVSRLWDIDKVSPEDWETDFIDNKDGSCTMYGIGFFAPYPHLFKKLEWWEDRKPEDMPQYVKIIEDGSYQRLNGDVYDPKTREVEVKYPAKGSVLKTNKGYKWHLLGVSMYLIQNRNKWVEIHASRLAPATEEEYNSHLLK